MMIYLEVHILHIKFPTQNIVVRDITYKLSTAYQIENQRL